MGREGGRRVGREEGGREGEREGGRDGQPVCVWYIISHLLPEDAPRV